MGGVEPSGSRCSGVRCCRCIRGLRLLSDTCHTALPERPGVTALSHKCMRNHLCTDIRCFHQHATFSRNVLDPKGSKQSECKHSLHTGGAMLAVLAMFFWNHEHTCMFIWAIACL